MSLQSLANLADIVGVIFVVASLIYVARELRQNTEMMRAESRNQIVHGHQQELLALIEHPEIMSGLLDGADFGDHAVRLHAWLTAHCRGREHEWFQLRNGALDQAAWESYSSAMPLVLSGAQAGAWWKAMKLSFDEGFVEQVDKLLEQSQQGDFHRQIGMMLRDVFAKSSAENQSGQ